MARRANQLRLVLVGLVVVSGVTRVAQGARVAPATGALAAALPRAVALVGTEDRRRRVSKDGEVSVLKDMRNIAPTKYGVFEGTNPGNQFRQIDERFRERIRKSTESRDFT